MVYVAKKQLVAEQLALLKSAKLNPISMESDMLAAIEALHFNGYIEEKKSTVIIDLGDSQTTIALVVGGALGNLTDRFVFGHVTDFLDFYWEAHHWPAFNVADSAICVGATLLILRELTRKHHASNPR
jgi:hypothetical protein